MSNNSTVNIYEEGTRYDKSKYFGSQILNRDTSISINSHCYLTGVERTELANNINQIGKIFSEHTGNDINNVWIGVFDIGELDINKFTEREVKDREEKYWQNSIHVRFRGFKVLVYSWLDINQFSQDQWNNFLLQLKRDHEVNFIGAGPLTFKYKDFNYRVYPPLFDSSNNKKSFLNNPEVYNFSPTEVNEIIEDIKESHQSIEKKIASYYESLGKDFVKNGEGYIHINTDIGENNVKNFTDVSYKNKPDGIHKKPIKEAFVKDDVGGDLLHSYVYGNKEALMKLMFKLSIFNDDSINDDSINAVNANGKTPLHLAAEYGRGAMVEMLLNKKAKVDIADNRGKTPLHLAAQYNEKKEIVEMLLNQGAKVDIADNLGRTPLHFAARNNNKEVVKALLDKGGIDVNAKDNDGNTPLHFAANHDHKEVVEVLLKGGANVNAKNKSGWTPLHFAARNNNKEVVKALLDEGANVDVQNDKEETPLHFAARNNNKEVVKALLGKGANVDVQNDKGETPLHFAARNNNKEVVKALLGKGANVDVQNDKGETPLHFAARNNNKEVVKALLDKGANVDAEDEDGNTPLKLATDDKIKTLLQNTAALLDAAKNGDVDEVRALISIGASVNAVDKDGSTPLHLAALNGHKDVVKALLDEGANVDAEDEDGNTPLKLATDDKIKTLLQNTAALLDAAKNGDVDEVRALISIGASVNAVDKDGSTPLHLAALNGHKDVVKALLDEEANVNAKDNSGRTPLHLAALNGKKDVVKALLDKGANVNAQNDREETPLHLAAVRGHKEVVEALLGKGANVDVQNDEGETPLHLAAEYAKKEVVKALLDKGANVNAKDNSGCTPLHWAAEKGYTDIVNTLLGKGADVNAKNDKGETPFNSATDKGIQDLLQSVKDANDKLLKAAENGNIDDVKNLLREEGKAQVNATDNSGKTPLHFAALTGKKDVVKALLDKGANVDAKDNSGKTPLHLAAENGHKDVVKALLDKGANVDAQNKYGWTPLHEAAQMGYAEIVKALLDEEANVNAKDNSGKTPLHWAAQFNREKEVVEVLLTAKKVDINIVDRDGKTPLDLATDKGIKNLLRSVKDANDKLLKAAENGNIDDVKNLLREEGKAQVNATDNSGKTPLHLAAQNNNKEIVDALIKAGANINVKDKDEKTPFDLTTNEEIKTLFQKAAESPDAGLIDEPSTDSKGVQEEDAGTEKKEKQEGDAQSESDIAEKGTDVTTGSAQPIAPIEPAQTEEQPSSFFGSLFSILMKPFSLIASFFGGFFSWLFGSDEPIQSSSESDQPVVLESPNSSGDHDII